MQSGYPINIGNWGLPSNIDAAFKWSNKRTYFFIGGDYYRFNDRRFEIDSGDPEFPRPSGPWWFGCKPETLEESFFDILGLDRKDKDKLINFDLIGD